MSLKLRDFARTDVESEIISNREVNENESSDDDIIYEPPTARKSEFNELPAGHKDVPRNREDEKPFFGPRGMDGNIQVQYPSAIDGYKMDNKALLEMEKMGLPTGFSLQGAMDQDTRKERKGEKKTFYCEICLIVLNSLDTMTSHVKGVKHMKKQLAIDAEKSGQFQRGEISRSNYENQPKVIPIPNPESTKKKVPIRLHEKIKETRDPVVGLDWVREWIAVSDPEMEPHYECELCGNQGIANGMFSHLMGHKHRQKFVEEVYKDDPDKIIDLSQSDLLKYAREHNENNDNLSVRIRTRRSDEEYPWPPGKAPWATERGGTGIPPDGARENWGKNKHHDKAADVKDTKPVVVGRVFNGVSQGQKTSGLPSASSLKPPKDKEEAEKFIILGERLLSLGLEFCGSRISKKEASVLQTCLTTVVNKMKGKRGVQLSNGHHSPTRDRGAERLPESPKRRTPEDRGGRRDDQRNSRSPSSPAKRRRMPSETLSSSSSGPGHSNRRDRNGIRESREVEIREFRDVEIEDDIYGTGPSSWGRREVKRERSFSRESERRGHDGNYRRERDREDESRYYGGRRERSKGRRSREHY